MDRSSWPGRVFRRGERRPDDELVAGTVAERLAIMWPLAVDAWAMRGRRLLNPDFAEMLRALSDEDVEYLLVGAYAMAAHGVPRATGDIDIWVRVTGRPRDLVDVRLLEASGPRSGARRRRARRPKG